MRTFVKGFLYSVLSVACLLTVFAYSKPAVGDESSGGKVTLRRFLLAAGANFGGKDRVRLLYAGTDATAFSRVLGELGGVAPGDKILLKDPSRGELVKGFTNMKRRLVAAKDSGARLEVVFYYSGHSDEKGLLLNGELYTYKEVRAALDGLPADVRIAMLDSCASGALTRRKGGQWRAPFLVDESSQVKGHAFLTSSSADEAAQESDRVGGSFFTHYMVSGLRGAADISRDGKVTLNEAYQYAFNETLARTESTTAGAQHPSYDFQLTGAGDVVLTDLHGTSALLLLPDELEGRLFIRDSAGHLVAEINKPAGRPMSFGIEPGEYSLTVEQPMKLSKGTFTLKKGAKTTLAVAALEPVEREMTVSRGGVPSVSASGAKKVPVTLTIVPGLSTDPRADGPTVNNWAFNLLLGWGDYLEGAEFSGVGAIREGDASGAQLASTFNYTRGRVSGFQAAGTLSVAGGNFEGMQANGGGSVVLGDFGGFQAAGGGVLTKRNFEGFQAAGGASLTIGRMSGFQAAGAANYAGSMSGFQAGTVNITSGEASGAQLGVVNYSGEMSGAMIGVVNVAPKMGNSVPIGVINYAGDGILTPTFWGSDTMPTNAGIKMGSKVFYTTLGIGWDPREEEEIVAPVIGLGGHFDFDPVWVELDLMQQSHFHSNDWDDPSFVSKFRAVLGVRLFDWVSLYAGPTVNFSKTDADATAGLDYVWWEDTTSDGQYMSLRPGFAVGLQVEPQFGSLNSH